MKEKSIDSAHFEIVEASLKDAEAIFDIQKAAWLLTYPNPAIGITLEAIHTRFKDTAARVQRWRDRLSDEHQKTWIAKRGERVVGFCSVIKTDAERRLSSIYINPDDQHRGVGSALMGQALAYLGREKDIIVDVASYNENALQFYGKFGFRVSGPVPEERLLNIGGVSLPEVDMVLKAL